MSTTSSSTVKIDRDGAVATLTLNRPQARNACNAQMCNDIIAAAAALSADDSVHVVLVRGAGPVFCAGMDIKEKQQLSTTEMLARRALGFTAYDAIERIPHAVIAVVHGAAYGSGCEIAAACDFVLAGADASFCYPEVGWGTVGATQRLPRIAGTRMAKELLFTSRVFNADEACAIGLVNRVYASQDLDAAAAAMSLRIAGAPAATLRLTKRSIDRGVETTRDGAMAVELLAIQENMRTTDWHAAISGFGRDAGQ